jgi:Domain of unknown function (DUF4905)/PQQ-like domain
MPFFNSLRRRGLRPSWEFTTTGNIWLLHPSSRGRLVGEERDAEKKCATFFCVDLTTGTPLWKDKTFGDRWWTGIEGVCHGVVFLHGYAVPDMPEHKGITAADEETGEVLWQDERVAYIVAAGRAVYGSRTVPAGRLITEFEGRTGGVIREFAGDEAGAMSLPRGGDEITDVVLPSLLREGEAAELFRTACGAAPSGPVDYIVDGGVTIFAYYQRVSVQGRPSWTSYLAVVDRASGRLRLNTVLDDAVTSPGTDALLVRDATLYFVRRRRTLTAIALRDS